MARTIARREHYWPKRRDVEQLLSVGHRFGVGCAIVDVMPV
jgi:hypothetical protein